MIAKKNLARTNRALVFDLDGCVWYPEMYMLFGSTGGAPFAQHPDGSGDLATSGGGRVSLIGDVRQIMREIAEKDRRFRRAGTVVAVASRWKNTFFPLCFHK